MKNNNRSRIDIIEWVNRIELIWRKENKWIGIWDADRYWSIRKKWLIEKKESETLEIEPIYICIYILFYLLLLIIIGSAAGSSDSVSSVIKLVWHVEHSCLPLLSGPDWIFLICGCFIHVYELLYTVL